MYYYLKNRGTKSITLKSLGVTIKPNGVIRVAKAVFLKNYLSFKKDPMAIKVKMVGPVQYAQMNKKNTTKKKKAVTKEPTTKPVDEEVKPADEEPTVKPADEEVKPADEEPTTKPADEEPTTKPADEEVKPVDEKTTNKPARATRTARATNSKPKNSTK